MQHKKLLLLVFLLTLFVFQQVQAGGTMPPRENPSQISFAPAYAPLPTIWVFALHLDSETNGILYDIPVKCWNGDTTHGCGIIDPEQPNTPRNPVPITVDPYYLRDVITIEMNVGQIPPTDQELPALKAQAIAARTVASWKAANLPYAYDFGDGFGIVGGRGYINNSTQYQVFIPGSYDTFPAAQDLIDQAITETQGQFLSYGPEGINPNTGERMVIDAEFSSDIIPESAYGNQLYLQKIQEPISSGVCNVQGTVGNDWGMSQRGAIRWAIGNTCPDESGTSWPVIWTDYRQILVHYYTGIDILDGNGGKVAPDGRWNLINHTLPLNANRVATVNAGETLFFNITVQNTSAANFNWSDVVIGYKWNNGNWTVLPNNVSSTSLVNPPNDPLAGNPAVDFPLSILVPTDLPANSTLHLDLGHQIDSQTVHWFSEQSPAWPDARIAVAVSGGSTPTATPTAAPPTPIAAGKLYARNGSGPDIETVPNLIPGMQYRIAISGAIKLNSTTFADAQWNTYQCAAGSYCSYYRRVRFNGVALAAQNGQTGHDPGHVYTYLWTASNAQLQMYIWDNYYADNSGYFEYQIYENAYLSFSVRL